MALIDRHAVRRAFDSQAVFYEETVVVQKRVREKILGQLMEMKDGDAPRRILDVGAGTGMLLRDLRGICPEAFLVGIDLAPGMGRTAMATVGDGDDKLFVEGDAERLPFADCSFDLVISTSTFQWLNTLKPAFCEAMRVLSSGGSFRFALFGCDTLHELRTSYRSASNISAHDSGDRTHRFFSLQDVEAALKYAGFSQCRVEKDTEKEFHPDVSSLLRSLRRIGAGNASSMGDRGLAGKRVMTGMMEIYQREFGCDQGIPATYDVVYAVGIKA
ncbi:MAG: methyltransferase domain-containing protein [Geobacteraceae bacterium]|nr:methyltransferase domain-containing protein [Geobacteraceae bacterium]